MVNKMKEEIKSLRVQIDGLTKLVKKLKPFGFYKLDLATIPTGMTVEDVLDRFRETGIYIYDSNNRSTAGLKSSIEELPVVYREVNNTVDSLLLGKAWLGKILGQLGEPTPYQNDGKRKTVGDIEDVSDGVPENRFFITKEYNDKNHIEKVDYLREEIQKLINNTSDFSEVYPEVELEQGFVYKYLTEAKMWLGFELGRVRDEHKEMAK